MWLPRSDNDLALPAYARAQAEPITGSNTVTGLVSRLSHAEHGHGFSMTFFEKQNDYVYVFELNDFQGVN
jgi:hypothetical protein